MTTEAKPKLCTDSKESLHTGDEAEGQKMKEYTKYFIKYNFIGYLSKAKEISFEQKIEFEKGAHAFTVFQHDFIEKDDKIYKTEEKQISKEVWHPDSIITTIDDLKSDKYKHLSTPILIKNMDVNKIDLLIWQPSRHRPLPYNPKTMIIARKDSDIRLVDISTSKPMKNIETKIKIEF